MANMNEVDNFIQKFTTYSFRSTYGFRSLKANVNGADNFIQKFTRYSFISLKVWPT